MSIEDIKRIAESVFPDKVPQKKRRYGDELVVTICGDFPYQDKSFVFDPENDDADAFKVLLALQKLADIYIGKDGIVWVKILRDEPEDFGYDNLPFKGKTLNEAICRAYLNTVGEEG